MKYNILGLSSLLLASCASTGISTPPTFKLSADQYCNVSKNTNCDARFNVNYTKLKNLHNNLHRDATALAREGTFINGITASAAAMVLAFAGFEAHPNNIKASAIISAAGVATATQLKPFDRARLRIKGMSALTCIAGKADTFRDLTSRSNQILNTGLQELNKILLVSGYDKNSVIYMAAQKSTTNSRIDRSGYDVLDDLLFLFLTKAQNEATPTNTLKAVIPVAQQSRTKLALGIKAQNEAFCAMSNAIELVRIAIDNETPPSLTQLVEALSKVELPKAPIAPIAESTDEGVKIALGEFVFQWVKDKSKARADGLAIILAFLVSKVNQLTPELDATTVRGMTTCVAGLSSS